MEEGFSLDDIKSLLNSFIEGMKTIFNVENAQTTP